MRKYILLATLLLSGAGWPIQLSGQCLPEGVVPIPLFSNQNQPCNNDPWVLILEDEFDGNQLDLAKWTPLLLFGNVNLNNKYSYYKESNAVVNNGKLNLVANNDAPEGYLDYWYDPEPDIPPGPPFPDEIMSDHLPNERTFPYSTGAVTSNYRYEYGKFEIMCKLPSGKGFWPAFWLHFSTNDPAYITDDFNPTPLKEYNEIDVFEFWDNNYSRQCMTIHHDANTRSGGCQECVTGVNGADGMHKYTLEWDEYAMKFYTDDVLVRFYPRYWINFPFPILSPASCEQMNDGIPDFVYRWPAYPTNSPMHVLANLSIDNRHDGIYLPDATTMFPKQMEIEYIKCWAKKPCSGNIVLNDLTAFDMSNYYQKTIRPEYNLQTGGKISTNGSMTVPAFNQLELRASESVTINPGFFADKKTNLLFHIDPQMCNSAQRVQNPDLTSPVAADSTVSDKLMKMYPNPTTGKFKMVTANPVIGITIYDARGLLVYTQNNIASDAEIDLSSLSDGIYFLRSVDSKGNEYSGKLILQR